MSDFGDFEDSDAFDSAPPDPEQVARKLHRYRIDRGRELIDWEQLDDADRNDLIEIIARLLDWLRREGAIR